MRPGKAPAGDEVLRPLEHHAHALELVQTQRRLLAGAPDAPGAFGADARHPQQHFKGRTVHIHREQPVVLHRPVAFGVQIGVEVGVVPVQKFLCLELVKAEQPVCLIEPMLPQQRRLGVQRGQAGVLGHRDVGGVKHPFQVILIV